MAESSVIRILDVNAKQGIGKTGKPWSMSKVQLQTGEQVYIFNPIGIGDVVESVQNGEYINWNRKRDAQPQRSDQSDVLQSDDSPSNIPDNTAQLDRIESTLQEIDSKLDKLMGVE